MEAAGLGLFMLWPAPSPSCSAIRSRRCTGSSAPQLSVPDGRAMGLTAVALIYSPWGRRSGAHLNPAVSLTFWRLGKMAGWDATFYVVGPVLGGLAGVLVRAAGSAAAAGRSRPSTTR